MSDSDLDKVRVSVWCRGPAVSWSTLSKMEKLAILTRNRPDDVSDPLSLISSRFSECGPQLVELDLSVPDDVYPLDCPVCGTDTNFDMNLFYKDHPGLKPPEQPT